MITMISSEKKLMYLSNNSTNRTIAKRIFSSILILGTLLWLGWIMASDLSFNSKDILPRNYLWFFIALFIGVISQFINVLIFYKFLRIDKNHYSLILISKLFFTGQLIRYMPGRIWGFLYQVINAPPEISKKNILLANIELMFVVFSGLLTCSVSIILYFTDSKYLSLLIFFSGLAVIVFVLVKGWLSKIISIAAFLLKKNTGEMKFTPLSFNISLSAVFLFLVSWIIYLTGWITLGEAGYGPTPYTMLILAATYSISWFIGYISMVTPSGIGVREASFLFLSQNIASSAEIASLAIIVRLWLLMIDLILFLIFVAARDTR